MAENKNKRRNYTKEEIKLMVQMEAIKQGVDPRIALAVAEQESGFNPYAENKVNGEGRGVDQGVMQINNKWHKLKNPFDPQENIEYGIRHLKGLIAGANGDISRALSNYNAGAGATGNARAQGDRYAQSVLARASRNNTITGAATPITPNESGVLEGGVSTSETPVDAYIRLLQEADRRARQNINDYFTQGYNFEDYNKLTKQRGEAYNQALKNLEANSPTDLSQQEKADIRKDYEQARDRAEIRNAVTNAEISQAMNPNSTIQPQINEMDRRYRELEQRAIENNPYAQMVQAANLTPEQRERYATMSAISRQNANTYGLQNPTDLGQDMRDISFYKQTGLTPEQYMQMQAANQSVIMNMGQAANANAEAMYQRGEINRPQYLQMKMGLMNAMNNNDVNTVSNIYNTQNALRQTQIQAGQEDRARQFGAVQGTYDLQPYAMQGSNALNQANLSAINHQLNQVPNMANSMYNVAVPQTNKSTFDITKDPEFVINKQIQAGAMYSPNPQDLARANQRLEDYGITHGFLNPQTLYPSLYSNQQR